MKTSARFSASRLDSGAGRRPPWPLTLLIRALGSSPRWWSVPLVAGIGLGLSCTDEDEGGCVPGYEGCACSETVCLEGLRCLSGRCVDPMWMTPVDDAGGDGGMGDGAGDGAEPGESPDNVAACNALAAELECGGFDLSGALQCSLYADFPCDISDYFDCVRDTFACTDGVPDSSGIVECAELATCA